MAGSQRHMMTVAEAPTTGGRFDFEDGGTYVGNWADGKAHGFGVCTGPKGQGEFSGTWTNGYEQSGVYRWHAQAAYEGTWMMGKRTGLGVETKERWIYRGEWSDGYKGRYGIRISNSSSAKYEGTWTAGLQDGYGVETYSDGGSYSGQWLSGVRHGLGVRRSANYATATASFRPAHTMRDSLTSLRSKNESDSVVQQREKDLSEVRGGFVLRVRSDQNDATGSVPRRLSLFLRQSRSVERKAPGQGFMSRLRKQRSTGDILDETGGSMGVGGSSRRRKSGRHVSSSVRSTTSNSSRFSMDSVGTDAISAAPSQFGFDDAVVDPNVTEFFAGEWKGDKRSGFGICERSDGLRYEGEWYNNKKHGYGRTTYPDGSYEEGKYRNNAIVPSKSKLPFRADKTSERVEAAVVAAQQACKLGKEKSETAVQRMQTARQKAELAEFEADRARRNSDEARVRARYYSPDFKQPGSKLVKISEDAADPEVEEYQRKVEQVQAIEAAKQRAAELPHSSAAAAAVQQNADEIVPAAAQTTATVPSFRDPDLMRHDPAGREALEKLREEMKIHALTTGDMHDIQTEHQQLLGLDTQAMRKASFDPRKTPKKLSEIFQDSPHVVPDHFDQYNERSRSLSRQYSALSQTGSLPPQHSQYRSLQRTPSSGRPPAAGSTSLNRAPSEGRSATAAGSFQRSPSGSGRATMEQQRPGILKNSPSANQANIPAIVEPSVGAAAVSSQQRTPSLSRGAVAGTAASTLPHDTTHDSLGSQSLTPPPDVGNRRQSLPTQMRARPIGRERSDRSLTEHADQTLAHPSSLALSQVPEHVGTPQRVSPTQHSSRSIKGSPSPSNKVSSGQLALPAPDSPVVANKSSVVAASSGELVQRTSAAVQKSSAPSREEPKEGVLEVPKDSLSTPLKGSMPDIHRALKDLESGGLMSRQEASRLADIRRHQVRVAQEEDERRRAGDIAILVRDARDWCVQRQLLVFIVAVNLTLAGMFMHLMNPV